VRTGLEDNIRVTKDRLAASNAELVSLAAEMVTRHNRNRHPGLVGEDGAHGVRGEEGPEQGGVEGRERHRIISG
jgi:hypothetical protein